MGYSYYKSSFLEELVWFSLFGLGCLGIALPLKSIVDQERAKKNEISEKLIPIKYEVGKVLEERFSQSKLGDKYKLRVKNSNGIQYTLEIVKSWKTLRSLELELEKGDKIKYPIEDGFGPKMVGNYIDEIESQYITKIKK